MRYLGIDYGKKKIGIAVSDGDGSIAFPRKVLPNDEQLFRELVQLVEAEAIGEIVIGDARTLSGEVNAITPESDAFAKRLASTIAIPVRRAREAYSSAEAMRFAPPGKRHDDSSAAAIILQRFLDASKKSE
jgi:putative holliday junction resolvase